MLTAQAGPAATGAVEATAEAMAVAVAAAARLLDPGQVLTGAQALTETTTAQAAAAPGQVARERPQLRIAAAQGEAQRVLQLPQMAALILQGQAPRLIQQARTLAALLLGGLGISLTPREPDRKQPQIRRAYQVVYKAAAVVAAHLTRPPMTVRTSMAAVS